MQNKILIVEDSEHKRDKISSIIQGHLNNIEIIQAISFTSGWQSIIKDKYDLIILDMSLPTFDLETRSTFRTYAGEELARKIKRKGIDTKLVFITQYKSFSNLNVTRSLSSIATELNDAYKEQCLDVIHFDSSNAVWKNKLEVCLDSVFQRSN